MERKSFVSLGKLRTPKNQISLRYQGTPKEEINECFKVDTGDFPTLDDFSAKSQDQNKKIVGCSKTSFSYSDKLKSSPQEHPSQQLRFSNNPNNLNKSELNYNKLQTSYDKNNLLETKQHTKTNSQTKLDGGKPAKKSLQSFNSELNRKSSISTGRRQHSSRNEGADNLDGTSFKRIKDPQHLFSCNFSVVSDFATDKSLPASETSIPKKLETGSATPLSVEGAEDDGWTVFKKHSPAKKNRAPDKCRETANNSEKGAIANSRVTEQATASKYKNENYHDSSVKSKPPFIKYREHAASNYHHSNEVKSASNSNFEKNLERYRYGSKVYLPYHNSSILNHPKPNIQAHHSLSTPMHNYPLKQTTQKESGLDNKNRVRTNNKNITRNDFQSSNLNQFKSENSQSSRSIKPRPTEPKPTEEATVKSKKKRKSKVKRLAALQTGKLHILTPETHSRILNQSRSVSVKSQNSAFTNVNDEEYPELGMSVVPKNNKEVPCKTTGFEVKVEPSVLSEKHGLKHENCNAAASHSSIPNDNTEVSDVKVDDIVTIDGKITEDVKLPVHKNDPITVSLFDMLLTGKSKRKEPEEKIVEEDSTPENSPVKLKTKKVISQPVNPLASSKLTAKRGKEREQPKVKKPSKMRKLILMGRQMKKENMIQKGAAIEKEEKSDIDNDILSDDSSLSPTTSPGFEDVICGTSENNSSPIIDTLEDKDPSSSVRSCKKMLFPDEGLLEKECPLESCSLSTQSSLSQFKSTKVIYAGENVWSTDSTSPVLLDKSASSYEDSTLVQEKDCKTLDKDIEISFRNCDIFDTTHSGDYYETANHESTNLSLDLQNEKIFEECKLFEEGLKCQLVKTHDLDAYCNALVQSIVVGCMAEISLNSVKHFNEQTIEVLDLKSMSVSCEGNELTEIAKDLNIFEDVTKIQLQNINDYCCSLMQSILEDCFSEIKSCRSDSHFAFDLIGNLTLVDDNLPNNSLLMEDDSNKFTLPSETECFEDFSKSNCYASGVAENINIVGDALEKTDNCISSTISEDCEENISEEKPDPLSLCLENLSAVIEPEPLQSKFTYEEKMEAAKILLHTRKFRDYCTHFPTKDLEETIFSLIDDLARFQDRLHQKDPTKARAKRRLMYGIKEIKKHLKLKKLKCIIIATDIEDNKAEGGLNDLLKEVTSLSEAYHIPYVFSHKRFNLGKVCRKPTPVSCVGILNYEGSEKNFKKMLEIQEKSKCDYMALTKKIVQELTDNHIKSLFDTIQNATCPYEINKTILKELFGADPNEGNEKPKTVPTPQNDDSKIEPEKFGTNIDLVSNRNCKVENTYASKMPENNESIDSENVYTSDYFGILDDLDRINIHSILKKYNVIKT